MFDATPKKRIINTGQKYKAGVAVPVLAPEKMLVRRHHQKLLQHYRDLSKLTDDDYERYYEALLQRFADYVQALPEKPRGHLSGIFNEGLFFAYNCLASVDKKGDKADALQRYAVFSAALLHGIARIFINQKVVITNEKGFFVQDWMPFNGPIKDFGEYYKLFPIARINAGNWSIVTGMLLRAIMPQDGFDWIASDTALFHEWLAALQAEDPVDGRIGAELEHIRRGVELDGLDGLPEVPLTLIQTPDTQHGEAFHQWLVSGIEDGSIKVNAADAHVHMLAHGVLIEYPGLVRDFITQAYNTPVNMYTVFQQFGDLMGVAGMAGNDFKNTSFFSKYPAVSGKGGGLMGGASAVEQKRQGIVVKDAGAIFVNTEMPTVAKELTPVEPPAKNTSAYIARRPRRK